MESNEIKKIQDRMDRGFEITEEWLNDRAQRKVDEKNFKKIKTSKVFR